MRTHGSSATAQSTGIVIHLDLTPEEAAGLVAIAAAKGVLVENVLYDYAVALNAPTEAAKA